MASCHAVSARARRSVFQRRPGDCPGAKLAIQRRRDGLPQARSQAASRPGRKTCQTTAAQPGRPADIASKALGARADIHESFIDDKQPATFGAGLGQASKSRADDAPVGIVRVDDEWRGQRRRAASKSLDLAHLVAGDRRRAGDARHRSAQAPAPARVSPAPRHAEAESACQARRRHCRRGRAIGCCSDRREFARCAPAPAAASARWRAGRKADRSAG